MKIGQSRRPCRKVALTALAFAWLCPVAMVYAEDVAFEHVAIIPMDRKRVIPDQTLIVHGGKILSYGAASTTRVPAGARLIDGHGDFVIPGLTDMHVHIPVRNDVASPTTDDTRAFLFLLIANGVTTARNMAGSEAHLALRDGINAGRFEGPRLFTAAAIMDGDPPVTPLSMAFGSADKARAYVRWTAQKRFDFVKVYSALQPAVYDAIADEARKEGLPVAGHMPMLVPFDHALVAMRSIEHLTGFDVAFLPSPGTVTPNLANLYRGWSYGTPEKIRTLVAQAAKAGVWNDPTLVAEDYFETDYDWEKHLADPAYRYLPQKMRDDAFVNAAIDAPERANIEGSRLVRLAIVKALSDAGAPLLTGTDSPALTVIPGFSLHRELKDFVEAGLTPYQALQASTSEPARYLQRVGQFGAIVPGASADLVLLAANPLDDIANVDRIEGVVVRGRYYSKLMIAGRLEAQATQYAAVR
jgi:hypothetical protein